MKRRRNPSMTPAETRRVILETITDPRGDEMDVLEDIALEQEIVPSGNPRGQTYKESASGYADGGYDPHVVDSLVHVAGGPAVTGTHATWRAGAWEPAQPPNYPRTIVAWNARTLNNGERIAGVDLRLEGSSVLVDSVVSGLPTSPMSLDQMEVIAYGRALVVLSMLGELRVKHPFIGLKRDVPGWAGMIDGTVKERLVHRKAIVNEMKDMLVGVLNKARRNPASDDGPPETDVGQVAASRRRPPRVPRIVAKISREHDMRAPRVVGSARDAVIAFRDYIGDRSTEQYAVLYVDVRNQVIGFADYTEGSLSSVTVNAGDIIRNALLAGAPGFVTAHNHPSGNAEPSDDDFNLWDKIDRLATDMGLVALDHLVMGRDRYYARREASSGRYPE